METPLAMPELPQEVVQQIVYLMGISFILGSLITILLLMLVDYFRGRITSE